jgi:hypothetical protein
MLKKTINHNDYDGNPTTTVAYFHLNKFEWLELEAYTKGGLIENLEQALETNNTKKTIDILKKLILRAYGIKNPETGEFEKSDDIAIRFSRTEAFSELFYELAYNEDKSKEFFLGLIPPEVRTKAEAKLKELEASKTEESSETATVYPFTPTTE